MRRVALWANLILIGAEAQPIWIERGSEVFSSSLLAQAYRISLSEWALVLEVHTENWLPYAFDTLLSLTLQIVEEKDTLAETTFVIPAALQWRGSLVGTFQNIRPGKATGLYVFPSDLPEQLAFTRVYWPAAITPTWIESATNIISSTITLCRKGMPPITATIGDSMWQAVLLPAKVDTTLPLPPYVIRKERKTSWVPSPCAWSLKGDSTRIFWTCRWPPYPYEGAGLLSSSSISSEKWNTAFQRFSDKKPGDRTDRGLIYLFYAPPPVRLLTPTREVWIYPEKEVSFYFFLEEGSWKLRRHLEYQNLWRK
ncbi:MAG: GWxTD domain-containing protein [Bacteroidia bacterium]|nr:hypothetical protein [Bacteroidia bacterium]MDW8135007.1 GWxTD domain-containing protein [Bacteroidia bacterium]